MRQWRHVYGVSEEEEKEEEEEEETIFIEVNTSIENKRTIWITT